MTIEMHVEAFKCFAMVGMVVCIGVFLVGIASVCYWLVERAKNDESDRPRD